MEKSKAVFAEVFKLLGNKAYGKMIKAVESQTNVTYTKDEKVVDRVQRSVYFIDLDEIVEARFELESRKVKVTIRRPFYQLTKLRIWQVRRSQRFRADPDGHGQ